VYYSNRAAAYFGQKKFIESREDAVCLKKKITRRSDYKKE
jgi:hypothetical protein